MEARLQDYPTLRMSAAKLIDEYPQPKQAEKQAEKRLRHRRGRNNGEVMQPRKPLHGIRRKRRDKPKSGSDAEAAQQTTANLSRT